MVPKIQKLNTPNITKWAWATTQSVKWMIAWNVSVVRNGALETSDEIEDDAGEIPAQRHVAQRVLHAAPHGGEEVDDHRRHDEFDGDGGDHRAILQKHRDRGVQKMMDARQRIEERQAPETDQRQAVAPDRLLENDRHEVVHHAPTDRRDEQADQIVDEQSADRAAAGAADEILRQKIAHRVGQRRPDERGQEVPQADIKRPGPLENRDHEVERHQQQSDQRQRIDPYRRFSPFDALCLPQENADRRADHDDLPGAEDEPRQLVV